MVTRPASDEALFDAKADCFPQEDLLQRILPGRNADRQDRAQAWAEWQTGYGQYVLARYVRSHNTTCAADDDIIQDALITAYLSVERETYQPRDGVPFTAYVVGIARNKIREARRRDRHHAGLEDEPDELERRLVGEIQRQPEHAIELREERALLRSGLSRLPAARRQVLENYLAGASTGEIAGRLAMSEALVRQHKCRGLRALQQTMQKQSDLQSGSLQLTM